MATVIFGDGYKDTDFCDIAGNGRAFVGLTTGGAVHFRPAPDGITPGPVVVVGNTTGKAVRIDQANASNRQALTIYSGANLWQSTKMGASGSWTAL